MTLLRFGPLTLTFPAQASDVLVLQKAFICDDASVSAGFCTNEQLGEFNLSPNASEVSKNQIITQAVHLKDPAAIQYDIKKTGYYCVGTWGYSAGDYKAVVEFRNAYGELQAAQIPKLPFYAGLTIVYALLGM